MSIHGFPAFSVVGSGDGIFHGQSHWVCAFFLLKLLYLVIEYFMVGK